MLIVKKYGGSSVSTPEKILEIAQRLKVLYDQGHKLIIIVSAMGDTTDDLVALSRRITHVPIQREIDMLLSSGERISMALMAIALNSLGCPAISFTGSQSGVFTDGSHNSARIIDVKATRVEAELKNNRIVIIAGFQGVNPITKEVTTLGRGGSDTTAVALAAFFKADRCDILTDVRGLYTIDPRVQGASPQTLPHLDFETTMEMTYWGARVLHYRSVELAERAQVPLHVHLSSEIGVGTMVQMESTNIIAINYNSELAGIYFSESFDLKGALDAINHALTASQMALPKIVYEREGKNGREIFISSAPELFEGIFTAISTWCEKHKKPAPTLNTGFATVTITGRGLTHSNVIFDASHELSANGINPEALITSGTSVTFMIARDQVQKAALKLHEKFVK